MALNPLTSLSNLLAKTKLQLKPVVANVERILNPVTQFIRANPLTSGLVLGVPAGVAGTKIIGAVSKRVKRKPKSKRVKATRKRRKTIKRKTRVRKKRTKRRKGQRQPYTAGKGKDTSTRRIRFTKNNQPYIILKSGKARFIKKSSVRRSRRLKGGKY